MAESLLDPALALAKPVNQKGTLPAGTPLAGSLVLVELSTGNVQVAAGRPIATEVDGPTWRRGGPGHRSHPAPWPIVKPFLLVAGLSEGKVRANEQINCRGYFFSRKARSIPLLDCQPRQRREHGPLMPLTHSRTPAIFILRGGA